MRTLACATFTLLAFLSSLTAAAQPPASPARAEAQPQASDARWSGYPVDVRLSTLVDHPAEFAGQRVRLPAVRVDRVISATLVELKDAREHGPYHFQIAYRPDRLLALLPAGVKVARGDVILLSGTLRTVRGAAATQQMAGATKDQLKHGNRAVLLATAATTIDGATLAR